MSLQLSSSSFSRCESSTLARLQANNFARGHYTIGKEIVDLVLDRSRLLFCLSEEKLLKVLPVWLRIG